MARTIPAAVQTRLENDLGEEPIIVLEIFWSGDTGSSEFYAERSIDTAPEVNPKIISVPPFDEAVQVSGGGQSSEFAVELDDTDGVIKAIFDTQDVHKITVQAWFYLLGTDFATEKVKIFRGQINSPVVWSEGFRTFSFNVVNRIEDVEVGFSAEEGEFPHLPEDLIGRPWPLCFGSTINVPALRAVPAVSGLLAGDGVGIKDFTLDRRLALAEDITCPQTPIGFKCRTISSGAGQYSAECNIAYETDQSCLQARCVEIERLKLQLEEQSFYEFSSILIFGGKEFPQGRRITLNINGGLFHGFFDGTPQNPSETFRIVWRRHPEDDGTGNVITEPEEDEILSKCPSSQDAQDSDFTETAYGPVFTGLRSSRISWENYREEPSADFFWAQGGSTVVMQNRQEILYIANIIPSTIKRVAAFRTLNGNRFLLTVPPALFTIRQSDYTGYDVMEVVFDRPLSSSQLKQGGGWSDDIYISQISTVGPNTVDIMEWFIDTYTSYAKDTASFADVKTKIDNYPMHFPLLRRPNILTILQELAQMARCALWLKDDTFFIKYLSEEPTAVAAIGEGDILTDDSGSGTLQIELTSTEDLVTKLTAKWQKDYSLDDQNTLILRHNVNKYGTHAEEDDYFAYAHLQLVRKSATFWLIRRANTWKRIKFSTSLEFLELEAFDSVTFTLPDVGTGAFKGVIERAVLDSENKQINFEAWTPIRAGEMTPYDFAWPAQIAEHAIYPTVEARNRNQAGSGNEPNFSVVAPPGSPLETNTDGIYSGISLGCNGAAVTSLKPGECRQDFGDREPSDIGDQKPGVDIPDGKAKNVSGGTNPVGNGSGKDFWSLWQWYDDWNKKTEGDAGRGRETAYRGGTDQNEEGTTQDVDRDFLDDLPDPDDLDIPCQVNVVVSGFHTSESGTRPICLPGAIREETYAFNSSAEAAAFCEGLEANSRCGSEPPCLQCVNCGISTVKGEPGCEPEEGDVPGLVGFRGDQDPNRAFMNCSESGSC